MTHTHKTTQQTQGVYLIKNLHTGTIKVNYQKKKQRKTHAHRETQTKQKTAKKTVLHNNHR